jgi:hypothetical protein
MKALSRSSISEVIRFAASASVRANNIVGTPHTSAASRRGNELVNGFLRRHEDLPTHMPAFLGR